MDPIIATEIAYKNGYAAGRDSALRGATVYALNDDEHITRCWHCKAQLIFNYSHAKHESQDANHYEFIKCPRCNSKIILPIAFSW